MQWLWMLAACGGDPQSTPEIEPNAPVALVDGGAIPLARIPASTINVPPKSGDGSIPQGLPCGETLEYVRTKNGVAEYKTPTPIRWTPVLGTGLNVRGPDGQEMTWEEDGQLRLNTWRSTARWIILRLPEQGQTIPAGDCQITSPKSTELEQNLNLSYSGMSAEEFVQRAIDRDNIMRTGLLVPAPGTLTWDVTLPPGAAFSGQGVILSSEFLNATPSDGATAIV